MAFRQPRTCQDHFDQSVCGVRSDQINGIKEDELLVMENLPPPVMSAVEQAIQVIHADPEHQFPATLRRDLYQLLRKSRSINVVAWLSIFCAERVLPIARNGAPDQANLAAHILDLARALATGEKVDRNEVNSFLNPGYYALVEPFFEDEHIRPLFNFRVNSAFFASYCALMQANGYVTLQKLTHYKIPIDGQMVSGKKLGDEYIARLASSDAAAAAAVAEAWDGNTEKWNRDKLKHFWEWWLLEALPEAWEQGAAK